MIPHLPPVDEDERLATLRRYRLLDTAPVEELDDLTMLAATICEAPIATISLIDEHRLWFKAKVGLEVSEAPRIRSFCGHILDRPGLLVVEDATKDERFATNSLVLAEPGIRFYAGAPLLTPEGTTLGTLCVLDFVPRKLTQMQEETLRVLSRHVMAQFELLLQHSQELRESEERNRAIVEASLDAIVTIDHEGRITGFNPAAEKIFGWPRAEVLGREMHETLIPPAYRNACRRGLARYLETGEAVVLNQRLEVTALRANSEEFPVELTVTLWGKSSPPQFIAFLRDLTVRKHAEDAVREHGRFAQATIDALSAHICVLDEHGTILATNDAWKRFAEANPPVTMSVQEGGNYLDVCDSTRGAEASEAVAFARGIRAVIAGERDVFEMEYPCHSRTERRWFTARVTRFPGDGPVRVVVAHENITAAKLAEEATHQSEDRLAFALEVAGIGAWDVDLASHIAYRSKQHGRIFGYSDPLPEWGYEAFLSHVLPEERAEVDRHIQLARTEKRDWSFECRIRRSDGEVRWIWGAGRHRLDQMGVARKASGIVQDITARKGAEAALREREEQLRIYAERSPVAIAMFDHEMRYLVVSQRWRDDLNLGDQPLVGRSHYDVFPDLPERWKEVHRRCLAGAVEKCNEDAFLRADGAMEWLRWEVQPWRQADGTIGGIIVFSESITERKKLEQQFLRAQRMESIGTLAGGIAHDLNNVLGPIMLSLGVLRKRFPDPGSRELLDVISASAQHGAEMVRQVLSFARGVEGLRMEVQIAHLVGDVEKIANDTFFKHIHVRTIIPHDLWTVRGDPTQLHQVLLNLCVNARDAMPEGGVLTISGKNVTLDAHFVATNPDAKPGPYVFLQVEDTGTGMTPEIVEKIFDPFFTTKEIGKGTGLGLSTSMAIVKSHNGFIRVESEMGGGTKFRVYLPALPTASAKAPEESPVELPRGNGELILVVDDEKAVCEVTKQVLHEFGYRAIVAADGTEAVGTYAARGAEIAAVLTDMMMPTMDGVATIRILRKINPDVRIIGASGVADGIRAAEATALGVEHFLAKPYTTEVLLATLKQVISKADVK